MKILHVFTVIDTARGFFNGQFRYIAEEGGHKLHLVSGSECDSVFCENNLLEYSQLYIARKIDIKGDLKTIRNLTHLIKKEGFDMVVGHTPKGAMVAMIAAKIARVKHRVYYRHGLIYTTASGLRRFILKSVERLTALCATKVVNVSPSLSKLAVKDRLNSNRKQTVLGLGTCGGIDTENLFNPRLISEEEKGRLKASLGIAPDDFVLGFCGRICRDKGIIELIDGFNLFKQRHPGVSAKLLIVGSYDVREVLGDNYKSIIENSLDIVYVGRIKKENLPVYYTLMNVLVLPSYREGFGMCTIEAAAMGVPALVSRSHGCIDSIVEDVTGQYIDISGEGIADGLERMLDSKLRGELGVNARRHAADNYDHKVLWPEVLRLYSQNV